MTTAVVKGVGGGGGLEGVTVHVLKCLVFSVPGTIIFCRFALKQCLHMRGNGPVPVR